MITFEGAWELLATSCPGNRNNKHEIEWIELSAITSKNTPYRFKDRRCIHCGLRDAFIEEGDE